MEGKAGSVGSLVEFSSSDMLINPKDFHPHAMIMLKSKATDKMLKGFVALPSKKTLFRSSTDSMLSGSGPLQGRIHSNIAEGSSTVDNREGVLSSLRSSVSEVNFSSLNDREPTACISPSQRPSSRLIAAENTRLGGVPASPGQVDVNGYLIPRNDMKDGVISYVRKQTNNRAAIPRKKKFPFNVGEQAFDESVGGDGSSQSMMSNTLSNSGVNTQIYSSEILKTYQATGEKKQDTTSDKSSSYSLIHSNTDVLENDFLKLTEKSKVSSIVNIQDDYAAKWLKMKQRRDYEFNQEMKLEKRQGLRHLLQRIAINSDR
jgi:hypothetical protein